MLDKSNRVGFVRGNDGKAVERYGYQKTAYVKEYPASGIRVIIEAFGPHFVKAAYGHLNGKTLYPWVKDPNNPDRGSFRPTSNPNFSRSDNQNAGGAKEFFSPP